MKWLKTCVGEIEKASEANLHTSQMIISLTRSKWEGNDWKGEKFALFPGELLHSSGDQKDLLRCLKRGDSPHVLMVSDCCLSVRSCSLSCRHNKWLSPAKIQISAAAFHHLSVHFLLHSPNPLVREIYGAASKPWDRLIVAELAGFTWNKWPGLLIVVPFKSRSFSARIFISQWTADMQAQGSSLSSICLLGWTPFSLEQK